jgi:branched-chain amino acid transport system permease protein
MGVNITSLKVRAFVLAAFFAGIAGALYAHQSGTLLRPADAGFQRSFDVVIMVVLGGMGSISGAALAAIILTVLQASLAEYAEYRMIVYALLLILMMILRPQGLLGVREIWELGPGIRRLFSRKRGR